MHPTPPDGPARLTDSTAMFLREMTLAVDCGGNEDYVIFLAHMLVSRDVVRAFVYADKWAKGLADGAEYDANAFEAAFEIIPSAIRARIALSGAWDRLEGCPRWRAVSDAILAVDEVLEAFPDALHILSPASWAMLAEVDDCLVYGGIWYADGYADFLERVAAMAN